MKHVLTTDCVVLAMSYLALPSCVLPAGSTSHGSGDTETLDTVSIQSFTINSASTSIGVALDDPAHLVWSSNGASQCELNQSPGSQVAGAVATSGSQVAYFTETTLVTLSCRSGGALAQRSIEVALPVDGILIYVDAAGSPTASGSLDDPFPTLEAARDRVRELRAARALTHPVRILLRHGTHALERTFNLVAHLDSGTPESPTIIRSFPGERAVVTGSQPLVGSWQDSGAGPWTLDVGAHLNAFGSFNSLFVNGERTVRARHPNRGRFHLMAGIPAASPTSSFEFFSGNIDPTWTHLQQVEVTSYQKWLQRRVRIDRIEGSVVHLAGAPLDPSRAYDWDYDGTTGRYYCDNVREALDVPGEWYLDETAHLLTYWPRAGENPNASEFRAPVVESLMRLGGQPIPTTHSLSGSFTISLWTRTTSTASQMYVLGNTGNANGFRFGLSGGRVAFLIGDGDSSTLNPYFEGTCGDTTVSDGLWHMITGVFDRGELVTRCYVDGQLDGSVPWPRDFAAMSTAPPAIGSPPCCSPFVGDLDELRVVAAALDPGDIASICTVEQTGVPAAPVGNVYLSESFALPAPPDPMSLFAISETGNRQSVPGMVGLASHFDGDDGVTLALRRLTNVRLERLTLTDTDWELPSEGYAGSQAAAAAKGSGGIQLYLQGGGVWHSDILNHGGYGITSASRDISIVGNSVSQCGAGGIAVRTSSEVDASGHTITDNVVHDNNQVFAEAVGVWIQNASDNVIAHNHIYNATYSGISVGWTWHAGETTCRNNTVHHNVIHDVMRELNDGAGIYLLGYQPNTTVHHNLIHDVLATPSHLHSHHLYGLYIDQGGSGMRLENNLVHRTTSGGLLLHRGFDNHISNNILADGNERQLTFVGGNDLDSARGIPPQGNTFEHNIVFYQHDAPIFYHAGTHVATSLARSEYNLYFNPNFGSDPTSTFSQDLQAWRSTLGFDTTSVVADPLFANPAQGDFTVAAGSPTTDIDFVPIDLTEVGPRTAGKP